MKRRGHRRRDRALPALRIVEARAQSTQCIEGCLVGLHGWTPTPFEGCHVARPQEHGIYGEGGGGDQGGSEGRLRSWQVLTVKEAQGEGKGLKQKKSTVIRRHELR